VLPSEYDPENYLIDERKIRGRCLRCGADNDPSYRYCRSCAEQLEDHPEPRDPIG
jgi:predicted amidophosphoribosyltransferase